MNTFNLRLILKPCPEFPKGHNIIVHTFQCKYDASRVLYESDVNPILHSKRGEISLTYLALEMIGIVFSSLRIMGPTRMDMLRNLPLSEYMGSLVID